MGRIVETKELYKYTINERDVYLDVEVTKN